MIHSIQYLFGPTLNNDPVVGAKKFNPNHDERGRFATAGSGGDIQLATSTKDFRKACKLLGIDPIDAGEAIHAAKDNRRLSGADECVFDLQNGNILFQGEVIGNLHD